MKNLPQYDLPYQKLVILKYKLLDDQKIKKGVDIKQDHLHQQDQRMMC